MEEKFETQLTKVYPNGLTGKEIIRRIQDVYHAGYDLNNSDFDIYDQLLACEVIAEAEHQEDYERTNESVNVKWSVNDTYKRNVNSALTESKQKVIAELKTFTYRTPPITISQLLQTLFVDCDSKDGHWLYVAQNWNPRTISRVLLQMIKLHNSGMKTILNPAAYFTHLIKFRKKRKFTGINGGR